MGELQLGAVAPDFVLPGVRVVDGVAERADYRLSEHRDTPTVLAFYPADASKVCTEQLCSYQDEFGGFDALGAQVWGISPQGLESHEDFARSKGLTFPLLADVDGAVAEQFGAMGKTFRRSVFIIDGNGVVRWSHVAKIGFGYRKAIEIREQLRLLLPTPGGKSFTLAAPE
ncbi:MAG TPA: peroxiredoxin [Pseudolysinimonas sp.]|nr:peroxiredoxin [Pseudolysinimonas sp.]